MRILAIDFGLSRIGLAINLEKIAEPLMVISNSPNVVSKIAEICQKNKIEKIVIGLTEGQLAKVTKEFAGKLFLSCQIPFEFQDETLTSKGALARMISSGKGKKVRRVMEDAFAAACILEEYLEERRRNV